VVASVTRPSVADDPLGRVLAGYLSGVAVPVDAVRPAAAALVCCFREKGKVLIFGNGGSAACAQHLAAEFVGRMVRDRPPLGAVALTADTAVLTAIANDYGFEQVFARQIAALGRPGDVALAISTSGASPNVLAGVATARSLGMVSIGLVGGGRTPLRERVDHPIVMPTTDTKQVQELHLVVQHALCGSVEATLFPDPPHRAIRDPLREPLAAQAPPAAR
jgi:D-sedoheptulose 7-phosphate isomerase